MLRRIHLHGPFAAFHDGPIEIFAATVFEALEAVTLQLRGFAPDPVNGRKKVRVVGFPTIESMHQPTEVVDLHILPQMTFGKNGGLVQTVVGAVLVVVSIFVAPYAPQLAAALMNVGIAMVTGGLIQMLTPQPKTTLDPQASKYIPANQNTVKIGTPIALLYGEHMIGGQIMSLEVVSKNAPTN